MHKLSLADINATDGTAYISGVTITKGCRKTSGGNGDIYYRLRLFYLKIYSSLEVNPPGMGVLIFKL